MTISLLFFGRLAELAAVDRLEDFEVPAESSLRELRELIGQRLPALNPHLESTAIAVNEEYRGSDHQLQPGDLVALIPPVSGG